MHLNVKAKEEEHMEDSDEPAPCSDPHPLEPGTASRS
jgi:hypothetical protein